MSENNKEKIFEKNWFWSTFTIIATIILIALQSLIPQYFPNLKYEIVLIFGMVTLFIFLVITFVITLFRDIKKIQDKLEIIEKDIKEEKNKEKEK